MDSQRSAPSWLTHFDDRFLRIAVFPCVPTLCRWRVHPNAVTLLALLLSAAIPVLHLRGFSGGVIAASLSRQILDCIDGELARRRGKVTRLGGLLDSISDAVLIFAILFVFASLLLPGRSPALALGLSSAAFIALAVNHAIICKGAAFLDHTVRTYDTPSLYRRGFALLTNDSLIFISAFALLYAFASGRAHHA